MQRFATALDAYNGQTYNVKVVVESNNVNTSAPSPPAAPYQVVYAATDAANNTARAVRRVAVVDSCAEASGEFRCAATKACSVFKSCTAGLAGAGGNTTNSTTAAAQKVRWQQQQQQQQQQQLRQ